MVRKARAPSSSSLNVNISSLALACLLKTERTLTGREISVARGITEILLFPFFYSTKEISELLC